MNTIDAFVAGSVVQAGVVAGGVHVHAPPQAVMVPHQLPVAPRTFVGRVAELAELATYLGIGSSSVEGPKLAAIVGPGGMGKTWLGLRWASLEMDRFPDGQLFLDLQGFSPGREPLSTDRALRVLLHGLGVKQAALPADAEARIGLYRTLVAGKRILIMLDNASNAEQVASLLPGASPCVVLVTSRNRLVGLTAHGARIVGLREMSDSEADELLTEGLGWERTHAELSAVTRLVTACAGLPLALSVVTARAAMHPAFSLDVLARELDSHYHDGRLDALDAGDLPLNVRTAFACSYQALSFDAAAMFGLLGLAPGLDAGVTAIANLVSTSVREARRSLVELENAHMVEQYVPGRYRMHDLMRLYARECAFGGQEKRARECATRRIVEYYARIASAADALLDSRGNALVLDLPELPADGQESLVLETREDAWTWLETEREIVCAAQAMALEMNWFDLVFHLAWTMDAFLSRRAYRHDRLNMWSLALAAAQQADDDSILCRAHLMVGDASSYFAAHRESLAHLEHALTLSVKSQDRQVEAVVHQSLATMWTRTGDDWAAVHHETKALRIYQSLSNRAWETKTLNFVGWYLARVGQFDVARDFCEAALKACRGLDDRKAEASTLDSLGFIAYHTRDFLLALNYYERALELQQELGHTFNEANTLDRIGQAQAALGRIDEAYSTWQRSLELFVTQQRQVNIMRIRRQLDVLPTAEAKTVNVENSNDSAAKAKAGAQP